MSNAKATVVVVPRERFSVARRSLESLIEHTLGCDMVYVDGGSPPALRRYLEEASARHGFRLLRYDCYLTPNEARNIGFAEVDTPYVVFVDNDVIVTPDWLEQLVACAEETGAWLVGPLYCQGEPLHEIIHMAGGEVFLEDNTEGRWLYEVHRYVGEPLAHVRHRLQREQTQVVEFHAMLVQCEALRCLGPLDERLMSTREHLDLCLRALRAGGNGRSSRTPITYPGPLLLEWSDAPFWVLRWSAANGDARPTGVSPRPGVLTTGTTWICGGESASIGTRRARCCAPPPASSPRHLRRRAVQCGPGWDG